MTSSETSESAPPIPIESLHTPGEIPLSMLDSPLISSGTSAAMILSGDKMTDHSSQTGPGTEGKPEAQKKPADATRPAKGKSPRKRRPTSAPLQFGLEPLPKR